MFSFIKKTREYSLAKKITIIILSCFVALIAWFLYVLNGLRILAPYYPFISGFPFQSKNYMVVFQNDTEIRPGGGFITAYGIIRFFSGVPTSFEISDVYPLAEGEKEYIEAPYPMEEMLKSPYYEGWRFQDSNWYGDFPTNAKKMLWFYNRQHPLDIMDGVIAVNFNVVEALLAIVGEVRVNTTLLNVNNSFTKLEYTVSNIDRHNVEDLQRRKDILKDFYSQLLRKTILSPITYDLITKKIVEKLDQKEIQMYFTDRIIQNMVERRQWGGVIPQPSSHDFLCILESNLGGMKSNRYMRKNIDYFVEIDEANRAKATVKINLSHFGDYNEPLSYTYKGFLRVLIPKDSALLKTNENLIESEESGYNVVGEKITIEPGKEETFTVSYILPPDVTQNNKYALSLCKQSGTNDHYQVTVHAPPDSILIGNDWTQRDNVAFYDTILSKDHFLQLEIKPDEIPPRITFQTFLNLSTIEIHFNEAVDKKECGKKENYVILDKNVKNKKTDTVSVTSVVCGEKGVKLFLSGVTKQQEEQYAVVVSNIRDIRGNIIDKNPKTITVVQRL